MLLKTITQGIFIAAIVAHSMQAQNTSCLSFDGVNDDVIIGNSSVFNITNNLTLEAWVKVDTQQFNDYNRIIDKFNYINQEGYNLIVNEGHLFMEFFSPDHESHNIYGDAYIQDGQWHHVAGTFSTDELKIYVDGVLDLSANVGEQTILTSTNPLSIGNSWDGQAFLPFHGLIDEVRIWNIVRSDQAINKNKDICLTGMEPGLVGYWRFDENMGLVAYDLTQNGNNGTLGNGPIWIDIGVPAQTCSPLEVDVTGTDGTCGLPNGNATAVANGGVPPYSYEWNTGETTESILNLEAGNYSITVTDDNGITVTGGVSILNMIPVSANVSSTDETALNSNDGTANATPTGGTPPYSFEWSTGDTSGFVMNLSPGDYMVTVTDVIGCTDIQNVTINAFVCPEFVIETALTNVNCFGQCDGSIMVIGVGQGMAPYTFLWSTGSTDVLISNLCAGEYSVTVVDIKSCSDSGTYQIIQPTELFANAVSTDETAQNASDGTAWAVPSGGVPPYSYAWNTGSTDSLIIGLMPGTYMVTVADANGCAATAEVTVEAFICLSAEFALMPISCFGECDGAIDLSVIGGAGPYTFSWDTGSSEEDISDLCAGDYSVTISDVGQDCSLEQQLMLIEPEPLVVDIDEIMHVTDSTMSAIFISVNGGTMPYFYDWVGPEGFMSEDEDITDVGPGYYSVAVIDAQGCSSMIDSVEVRDETVSTSDFSSLDFLVFPNPANRVVNFQTAAGGDVKVLLQDMHGRIIKTADNETVINVSGQPAGLYFLKFISGEKQFVSRLVIVH